MHPIAEIAGRLGAKFGIESLRKFPRRDVGYACDPQHDSRACRVHSLHCAFGQVRLQGGGARGAQPWNQSRLRLAWHRGAGQYRDLPRRHQRTSR
jgi:hypothetical protein